MFVVVISTFFSPFAVSFLCKQSLCLSSLSYNQCNSCYTNCSSSGERYWTWLLFYNFIIKSHLLEGLIP